MKNEELTMQKCAAAMRLRSRGFAFHCSLFIVRSSLFTFSALALPSALGAQTPSIDPPLAGRPAQFSNVVGSYDIAVKAEPAEVPVEEPITLRVTITGRGPAKYRPERKHLKLFPESWSRDFYVEPVPDEDRPGTDDGTWVFVFRLRPKHQQVTAIDGIKLVYYQPPGAAVPGKFQTRYAEAIKITVTPRPPPAVPEDLTVRTAPASFYELPDAALILTPGPDRPTVPLWLLLVVLLAPPLLTFAGVFCWRSRVGNGCNRSRPERSAVARRALIALAAKNGDPVWGILSDYLRDRIGFPSAEPTPGEVRRLLRKRGVSRPAAEKFAAFLGTCDGARFAAPGAASPIALHEEAGRQIQALEDDLCAP
jgi:hypothetical protein